MQFISSRFNRFKHYHLNILMNIFRANAIYGNLFLLYIIFSVPVNSYLLSLLLTGDRSNTGVGKAKFLFACIVIYQYWVLFGFHLIGAMYSSRIHACAKGLLGLSSSMCNREGKTSLVTKIKLSIYIDTVHTKNKYGIRYGSYGLLTLASFTKVSLGPQVWVPKFATGAF